MKNKLKKILAALLCMSLLIGALSACSGGSGSSKKLIEDGKLKVGTDNTYPPMEFVDEKTGDTTGFDIELAQKIADELGLELEVVPVAWEGIFTGLDAEKYDLVMSSASITEERKKNMEMSDPYVANSLVIVSNPKAEPVTTEKGLKGKKVGVQVDTTADVACKKFIADGADFELVQYDQVDQAFLAMEGGSVDNIVVDMPVAINYITKKPNDFVITSKSLTNEPIGVAIRKGNTELTDEVNAAIKKFQEDGTLKKLSKKWLGGEDYTTNIDPETKVIE